MRSNVQSRCPLDCCRPGARLAPMTDSVRAPLRRQVFSFASGRLATAAAIRSAMPCANRFPPRRPSRCWRMVGRGVQPARQRPRADRRDAGRARASWTGFSAACRQHGIVVPMATVNLFYDRCSATAHSPRTIHTYGVCGAENAARDGQRRRVRREDFRVCGAAARAPRTDACRRPDEAESGCVRRSIPLRVLAGPEVRLPLRPRGETNEPRGDIYMATTGAYLGFITRWRHSEWSASTGGRARADGGVEIPARGRAGVEAASSFTSI